MRALVTGGTGFLGGMLARQLALAGATVRTLARGRDPGLDALGIEQIQGDLADFSAVERAVAGCETVFHTAARAGVWGPRRLYWPPNVLGTEHVLRACREAGATRLVYTSSPSVVYRGRDLIGHAEEAAYPRRFLAWYPASKAAAERLVLAANSPGLMTVALRPHLVWGPGDPHFLPRLIDRSRSGRLIRVGDGSNLVDTTYIDNAALAHRQVAEALVAWDRAPAGRAYFIAQGEPVPFGDWIDRLLAAAGCPPVRRSMAPAVAYAAGAALEFGFRLLGRREEPPMTRFLARILATAHWYDLGAARRDWGYAPTISLDQGLERLETALNARDR